MGYYSAADARFDAWVTGNWGEDSVTDEEDEEGDYDAADSQIKAGVLAREIAGDLEDAILALEEAKKNMYDDPMEEEIVAGIVKQLRDLQEQYNSIGEAL